MAGRHGGLLKEEQAGEGLKREGKIWTAAMMLGEETARLSGKPGLRTSLSLHLAWTWRAQKTPNGLVLGSDSPQRSVPSPYWEEMNWGGD